MDFKQPYNRDEFVSFLSSFLPDDFERTEENIKLTDISFNPDKIKKIKLIGSVSSLENLRIYEIYHESEDDPRVTLSKEIFRLMSNYVVKKALAVFVSQKSSNYRFSLTTIELNLEGSRVTKKYSNPRRYSFYLGPDAKVHTPTEFLIKKGKIKDLKDLQNRFSIEVVTKSFFAELSNWYFWALKYVVFPKDSENEENGKNIAVIRLITRLIFIWFMKQKGLIPDYLFDESEIKNILKDLSPDGSTYYRAVLQNLFFASLNTPQNERRFRTEKRFYKGFNPDFGNNSIYRYQSDFREPENIIDYFKEIPFLNGGLFECFDIKEEEIFIDGFTDVRKNQPIVPNFLFFSEEKKIDLNEDYDIKEKRYKVRGIINLLQLYNFTIDESTPIDVEIALDPELLGRVFENLLASYNPETSTTARKATGSYYTPRPIVEFMVDESLKHYFVDKLKESFGDIENLEEKLEDLLSYYTEEHEFTEKQVDKLINDLEDLKVIDPAVGSGAFPMGILQKLVLVLSKLDPDNKKWEERQIKAIEENITDANLKMKLIDKVKENFKNSNLDYGRKLYLIQKTVFGVDIQPIAIQISKLRFFISLLVDEEVDSELENKGIEPLPNLETKFVSADSLIPLKKKGDKLILTSIKIDELESELRKVRANYFNASFPEEKREIKEKDKEIREKLFKEIEELGFEHKKLEKISAWNPYNSNISANFFDPEWMFGIRDGFDIVIANPPYIQLQKNRGKLADLYEDEKYVTFTRTGDIYCLFYERGLELSTKKTGILCYISSNKWMRADYGKKIRKFLLGKNPLKLIDFKGYKVFEGQTVDTNILLVQNQNNQNKLQAIVVGTDFTGEIDIRKYFEKSSINLQDLSEETWFIGSSAEQRLKEKIERIGKPLKDWDVNIYRGVLTGLNKAFIIDSQNGKEILRNCKDRDECKRTEAIIKPILRGRDIKRFSYHWAGLGVIGTFPALRLDIDDYPALKKYFLNNFDIRQLEQSGKKYPKLGFNARKKTGNKWFETQDPIAYYPEFKKEKVVWKRIGSILRFGYDTDGYYAQDSTVIMTGKNLKYLCAYMNSKLGNKLLFDKAPKTGTGDLIISVQALRPLLIPPIIPKNCPVVDNVEQLVDEILAAKKQNPSAETSNVEKQIDQLVYQLYGLTPEEIKIVENFSKDKIQ